MDKGHRVTWLECVLQFILALALTGRYARYLSEPFSGFRAEPSSVIPAGFAAAALCTLLYTLIAYGYRRNIFTAIVFLITPIEIIMLPTVIRFLKTPLVISLAIAAPFIGAYICIFAKNKSGKKGSARAWSFARGLHAITAVFLIPVCVMQINCAESAKPLKVLSPARNGGNEICLSGDEWQRMTFGKKAEALSCAAAAVSAELCLENTPDISLVYYPAGLHGSYDNTTNTVCLSAYYIETSTAREGISVLLHELRHVYQQELAYSDKNGRLSDSEAAIAAVYRSEFENYENGIFDYDKYYSQSCETDAREYAEKNAGRFLGKN